MNWRKLDLEISLKPFFDLSDDGIRNTGKIIFRQWEDLIRRAESVSLMFWIGDGSEILDYSGNMDDEFYWGRFIGTANKQSHFRTDTPLERKCVHEVARLYVDEPNRFSYGTLKRINALLKDEFMLTYGKVLECGATFDPGPEFAESDFKYCRHPETLGGLLNGTPLFMCCYHPLYPDKHHYAAFPDGIPDNCTQGTFLGRQAERFVGDLGYDYIWLSNGYGFGFETWTPCGALFDGEAFHPEMGDAIKDKIVSFWRDFRREFTYRIEVRGTNLATGMDLASDGVPLREIYREVDNFCPPPNSPWAALDSDFGLELCGWLSHIAELPEKSGYVFRYYTHDPWWINSPWIDRYARSPHDIYLPLAVCRGNGMGKVELPGALHFLSIDNSYGEMPDVVPMEVQPYICAMRETAPDQMGPLVWLYPFDEYHDLTYAGRRVEEIFFGDWFMRGAINCGLPVNTVISTHNFAEAVKKRSFRDAVIVVPALALSEGETGKLLTQQLSEGASVLVYGPCKNETAAAFCGLGLTDELSGDGKISGKNGLSGNIRLNPVYCAGGAAEYAKDKETEILAEFEFAGGKRVAAALKNCGSGKVLYIRGGNSFTMSRTEQFPRMLNRREFFYQESLPRFFLRELGFVLEFEKYLVESPDPMGSWRWHNNALYYAGFAADITQDIALGTPWGAPVFTSCETLVRDGLAHYHAERAVNRECRIFVEQKNPGVIRLKEACVEQPDVKRRLTIYNLEDATVRFRPENGTEDTMEVLCGDDADFPHTSTNFVRGERKEDGFGVYYEFTHVNERKFMICWGFEKEKRRSFKMNI